jgi:hypothetical protein
MPHLTASITNVNKPAPRWFRKTKKALTMLADTACVMLLAMGHQENSLIMLWCRVGLSGVLQSLEALLANGEEYVAVDNNPETNRNQ